ncbi:MAG: hypothetical protein MZV70_13040 [Desulfobacterales bacterium]|nr:hypothetical protein [Desulfobacterales bacterium]
MSCGGTQGHQAQPDHHRLDSAASAADPPMLSIAVRPERHSHADHQGHGRVCGEYPLRSAERKWTDWCVVWCQGATWISSPAPG